MLMLSTRITGYCFQNTLIEKVGRNFRHIIKKTAFYLLDKLNSTPDKAKGSLSPIGQIGPIQKILIFDFLFFLN